jgi:hypothetical protein
MNVEKADLAAEIPSASKTTTGAPMAGEKKLRTHANPRGGMAAYNLPSGMITDVFPRKQHGQVVVRELTP